MSEQYATLAVKFENLPEGELVQIPGLGEFANGSTYEVTTEMNETFMTYHTRHEVEYDKNGNSTIVVKPGQSLLDLNDTFYGITITANKKSKKPEGGIE